ncbi:hypothetical protein G4B88_000888 [Cannabis sativa]|uniref:Zinc finger GRF-type domain-containing protein n=1 Tax=Cannabis sativa TaxID=3483 RepID=A0A7J6DJN1_CANSA|nr:hypothetical protein G4B88_000888 [Cannabis sativa]
MGDASSSSRVSRRSHLQRFSPRRYSEIMKNISEARNPNICDCGELWVQRTSWTDTNPRRRFIGCKKMKNEMMKVRF